MHALWVCKEQARETERKRERRGKINNKKIPLQILTASIPFTWKIKYILIGLTKKQRVRILLL